MFIVFYKGHLDHLLDNYVTTGTGFFDLLVQMVPRRQAWLVK